MLNLDAIKSAHLEADPFDWALVERAIEPADAELLLDAFPREDFWLIEDDDGEKSYSYAARPLVTLGADALAPLSPLGSAWQRLGEALLAPSYRCALEELIGRSLQNALMEASVWRWDANAQLGPHRDMAEKVVTQVFYLSSEWSAEWGGCLRILRSQSHDDVAAELPPLNGSASVLVRSERSWHSVSPVQGAARQPRRSVIVTWFQPGSSSPVWKLGEDGAVACIAAGSVPEQERASGGEPRNSSAAPGFAAARTVRGSRAFEAPARLARRRGPAEAHRPRARIRPLLRQPAVRAPGTRVAMVGTFDIANFGDLLLPAIAAHELRARLGRDYEPTLYAYQPMRGATWAHEVRSLAQLPREIQHFDLLLIGGGQIIRFDRGFPAGYLPSDPSVHHPLGLWLTPMLLAAALGVPVAWNAPGVAADIPDWLAPTIGAALAGAGHVAVRDEVSAQLLRSLVPDAPACVVPDTGFGIRSLLSDEPTRGLNELLSTLGIAGGYVVVQPSAELQGLSGEVGSLLDAARERGLTVLELPLSPCHGDRQGTLGLPGATVSPDAWPEPLLLAELVGRAQGVVAQSFHAGVVAVACGVPLYRPASPPGWKYEALEGVEGVHVLGRGSGIGRVGAGEVDFGRGAPGPAASANAARLSSHWDAVAALARDGRRGGLPEAALELLADLPHQLHEREELMSERVESIEDELAASQAAAAERIDSLERASSSLLAQKDDLAARLATLTNELSGARARIADLDGVRERKIVRLGLLLTRPLLWLRRGDQRSGAKLDP